MRKVILSLTALAAIAVAVPASAETLVVKSGMHRHRDHARVVVVPRHHDRMWHRHHHSSVVIRAR